MADASTKKSNHISNMVTGVVNLLDAIQALKTLTSEASDLGYTDPTNGLKDTDFVGSNGYLTALQYRTVVNTLQGLDTQCSTPGANNTPSVYATLREMKP